jgi:hypothetical protein
LSDDVQSVPKAIAVNTSSFLVYPNPAINEISVLLSDAIDPYSIEIVNSLGAVMKQFSFMPAEQSNTINLASLGSGIYFVRLQTENASAIRRLVVLQP